MTEDPGMGVRAFLDGEAAEGRLTLLASAERAWDVMIPSYWKETIAVSLQLGERFLRGEAFFMRAPEDNPGEAYKLLLERNLRSRLWRFSAEGAGDVSLIADLPRQAIEPDELEQLFGSLVTVTDETYRPYFKLAFERALAEQVDRGGPGLDQPPPWAREWDRPRE